MPRFFNRQQKQALYFISSGKCSVCGQELADNWHADHVLPYSAGGLTDVVNGQALCPKCNRKKGNKMQLPPWSSELRKWQDEFYTKFFAHDFSDFLLVATPGAGKTIASLRIAHALLTAGVIKQIIVVCPTDHLRTQWLDDASEKGINLDKLQLGWSGNIAITSDFVGLVTTYHQVVSRQQELRAYVSRGTTLVIFDEIHHCGDEENLAWGKAIKVAFENARNRLLLSGTPFRSDNNPIPFVRYETASGGKNSRQSRADYTFGYGHALKDEYVVRHVVFPSWDGNLVWQTFGEQRQATFRDSLNRTDSGHRLRTAISPQGDWLRQVIETANKKLDYIRDVEGHRDAGGLIVAKDQDAAKQIAEIVSSITGEKVTVAISDDDDASAAIKKFRNGVQKWIVAVKMVSEGVDIKRLRVGVFATNVLTATFFRQVIGRVVRWDARWNSLDDQVAWFYLPEDPRLIELAKEIREEITHTISEQEDNDKKTREEYGASVPTQLSLLNEESSYEFQSSDGQESNHVYHGESFSQDELSEARQFMNFPGFEKVPNAALAYAWRHIKQLNPSSFAPATLPVQQTSNIPAYQLKEELKGVIKKKVGRLVRVCQQSGITLPGKTPYQAINNALGRRYSYSREASVAELEEKITWLESLIAKAIRGDRSLLVDIR